MTNLPPDLDIVRRRLSWRAMHRGIKEMDLIMGGFAETNLANMNRADLELFAEILEIPDQQLLSWVTSQESVPQQQKSKMLDDILAFRPRLHP